MKTIDTASTVIFDLFHTLTDLESNWSPIPPTSSLLGVPEKEWSKQLLKYSTKRLTGEWRDPFLILKTMARSIDPRIEDSLIREVVGRRIERMKAGLQAIPTDVIATLATLKQRGKNIGLVSNLDVMERSGWDESPLKKYIDVPILSCDVGLAKPDPRIFQRCLDELNERPENCLYVGDGGSNELVVSRALGMRSVFISGIMKEFRAERIEEFKSQANYHIERLAELLELEAEDTQEIPLTLSL